MATVLPDTGQRGRTTIDDRVVARLAAKAATEVDNVVGDGVAATADVRGDAVALDVRLAVAYPASIDRATRQAREHLISRVGALTGMAVSRVDITVTALRPGAPAGRRVR